MFTTREKKINREPKKGGRASFFPFFAIFCHFCPFCHFCHFCHFFCSELFFFHFFFFKFYCFWKVGNVPFPSFSAKFGFFKIYCPFYQVFSFFFSVKLDLLYRTFPSPLLGETSQKYRKTRKNKKTKRATRAPARHAPHGSPRFSLIWCSVFL